MPHRKPFALTLVAFLFSSLLLEIAFGFVPYPPSIEIIPPPDITIPPCTNAYLNWTINNLGGLVDPESIIHYVTFTAAILNSDQIEIMPPPNYAATYEIRAYNGSVLGSGSVNGIRTMESFAFWDPTGVKKFEMITWRLPDSQYFPGGGNIRLRFEIHCKDIGETDIILFAKATENHSFETLTDFTNLWRVEPQWFPLSGSYDPWDEDINTGHTFLVWDKIPTACCFVKGVVTITQIGQRRPRPPKAFFTENPESPFIGQTVNFDASLSEPGFDGDNSTPITEYRWDFNGDGIVDSTKNNPYATHTYTVKGQYNVTLRVTAPGIPPDIHIEYVNTNLMWHIKTVRECKPPVAAFTEDPESPLVNETVTLNASVSEGGFDGTYNCPIIWYYWEFGDSEKANESDPITIHTYEEAGNYNITLTVYAPAIQANVTCYNPYDTTWHIKIVRNLTTLFHDVAIIDVWPHTNRTYLDNLLHDECHAYAPWIVNITVIAKNEGNFSEVTDIEAYYDDHLIGKKPGISLEVGENKTLLFQWVVEGVQPCRYYNITAKAKPVPGETDLADNIKTSPTKVKVRMLGDINGDGIVDLFDILILVAAFDSTPGNPNWNPDANLTYMKAHDEIIDIFDLETIGKQFGRTCL